MLDFKQLAEGEKPTDLERFIVIEGIHKPANGKQWIVTGTALIRIARRPAVSPAIR